MERRRAARAQAGERMGFIDWLKSLFGGPKAVMRQTARLDEDATDADASQEQVEPSGGPLRPGRLRLVLRDPRLLPKPKPKVIDWRKKKKKVMSKEEAVRLFGATLRTKNRRIRDLLPDEAQLERYGLPLWRTEEDLATALGVSVSKLRSYSVHRPRERVTHYVQFALPKRRGGERLISAPKRGLKQLQRRLLSELVAKLPVSSAAHGFVKTRSIRTAAAPHEKPALLLRFDLEEFFPSITYARLRGYLIAMGYGYPVAAALAVLMTEAERQPVVIDEQTYYVPVGPRVLAQGAPTSPGLANAICLRLDRRLGGLAKKEGLAFTRYADDLSFSTRDPSFAVPRFLGNLRRIVEDEGFRLNRAKTKVMRPSKAQVVTGVTVNETLGLSRTERRRIRAMIHRQEKPGATPSAEEQQALNGKLAYLNMLNPAQAAPLVRRRRAPQR